MGTAHITEIRYCSCVVSEDFNMAMSTVIEKRLKIKLDCLKFFCIIMHDLLCFPGLWYRPNPDLKHQCTKLW